MDGIERSGRRPAESSDETVPEPLTQAQRSREAENRANAPWLASFTSTVDIPYPPLLFAGGPGRAAGGAPTAAVAADRARIESVTRPNAKLGTLADVTTELLRLRQLKIPASDSALKHAVAARQHALTSVWLEKAKANGMREPPAGFSPWTASNADLGSAFLFTHVAGVVPLDAARHDGGARFREDVLEAFALRTPGLDDVLLDSYASEPSTQRHLLERELRRVGGDAQCKPGASVDEMRLRRAQLLAGDRRIAEDKTLYIGLDGRVGTFDALVTYELEQRVRASNPGTTLGTLSATAATARGKDTEQIRAAGQLGNSVQDIANGVSDITKPPPPPPARH